MKDAARTEGKDSILGPTRRKNSEKDALVDPCISYAPHPNATPEGEVVALANIYRFLFDTTTRRMKVTETAARDEGEEVAEHSRTGEIVSEERS